jgi:hypothetical protein
MTDGLTHSEQWHDAQTLCQLDANAATMAPATIRSNDRVYGRDDLLPTMQSSVGHTPHSSDPAWQATFSEG